LILEKITYVTKPHRKGVTRLGIPKGFEYSSTKEIWDYLSVPTLQPEWKFVTDNDTIQRRLLEWQEFHYAHAGVTPLAASVWYDKLNPNAISDEEINRVLRGSSTDLPMYAHPSTQFFFKFELKSTSENANITTGHYRKNYVNFYSKVKERTSSSPSGLHMGLWKAAATSSRLSEILATILQISPSNSFVLHR